MTLEQQIHDLEVRVKKLEQYIKTLQEEKEEDVRLAAIADEATLNIGNDLN
jgi:phosphopantetheine adenylyltransferase